SDRIAYIYKKQIEEADVVILNKIDAAPKALLQSLKPVLEEHAREASVFSVSARTGAGLEEWFEQILRDDYFAPRSVPMDYNLFAEGEALLGWLNCTVRLS